MKTAILSAMVMVSACLALAQPRATGGPDKPGADLAAVVQGGNEFATDLYARLAAAEKGNLFFSPSSIQTALAMTYAGAAGRTAEQMAATLRYTLPGNRLHPAFGELIKTLNIPPLTRERKPAYELVVSNALWPQKDFPFKPDFVTLVKDSYGAELEPMDYVQAAEQARKTINDAVARQTKDKIRDLIPPGVLNALTRLVLTNAIYFKSNWASKFEKSATREGPFSLAPGKTVQVPLMRQQDPFGYAETDELQVLEMPYMNRRLSMVVLLPKAVDGLAALEKKLSAKALGEWLAGVKGEEVNVTLPRFTFSSQFSLADVLKAMGMTDAFQPDQADFSGMTTMEKLFISAVIHKAFVAVDEEGTEAAAATAVVIQTTAMPMPREPKVFKADHPFLFLIRHNGTGAILFMGRVAAPAGGGAAPGASDPPLRELPRPGVRPLPPVRPMPVPAPAPQPVGVGAVRGKVIDAAGKPVEGAGVAVYVVEANRRIRTLATAKTGRDGSFKLTGVPAGDNLLLWVAFQVPDGPQLMADRRDLSVEAGKDTDAGTIKIEPARL